MVFCNASDTSFTHIDLAVRIELGYRYHHHHHEQQQFHHRNQQPHSFNMCDTRALITTKQTSDLHSCWIIYTKSDGRERLTVTDAKPVTDLTNNNNNINSHNNNGNNNENNQNGLLNGLYDEDIDADVDAGCECTEQSLAEILDHELQPEPPIPNNAESQAIYRDHRHMAKEYLSVDTNLYYAQDFKEKLILQMDRIEREQKQDLLRKIKDKEGLQSLYNNLQQQWEKLPAARQANTHQRLQPHAISSNTSQEVSSGGIGNATTDTIENDGWVVISPHHNT